MEYLRNDWATDKTISVAKIQEDITPGEFARALDEIKVCDTHISIISSLNTLPGKVTAAVTLQKD